ncbi:hypothetical protein QE152_g29281 [Popillia japonica]|uniref:Uncharacterized protein n=1 Tax=Popillia japonica TaxID=7064 RepID=A0AAW1JJB5_POPJA
MLEKWANVSVKRFCGLVPNPRQKVVFEDDEMRGAKTEDATPKKVVAKCQHALILMLEKWANVSVKRFCRLVPNPQQKGVFEDDETIFCRNVRKFQEKTYPAYYWRCASRHLERCKDVEERSEF